MGTLFDIEAYGPGADGAISEAFAETARLDRALSLYKPDSEVSRLNRAGGEWFSCGDALWEAVDASLRYGKASGGAFDATILPVLKDGPAALAKVGWGKVRTDPATRRVQLPPGGMMDFGGIGKGIALDHAAHILRLRGINSARLNFGGQLYLLGAPPDAPAWTVRVDGAPETFLLKDASISTSGNAEHPGHIASPFTGQRIWGAYSAVVVAPSATEADAWSTAAFVLGPDAPKPYGGCWLIEGARPSASPACAPLLAPPTAKGNRS